MKVNPDPTSNPIPIPTPTPIPTRNLNPSPNLHHTLEPRGRLERGARGVRVLGVDELDHHAATRLVRVRVRVRDRARARVRVRVRPI